MKSRVPKNKIEIYSSEDLVANGKIEWVTLMGLLGLFMVKWRTPRLDMVGEFLMLIEF